MLVVLDISNIFYKKYWSIISIVVFLRSSFFFLNEPNESFLNPPDYVLIILWCQLEIKLRTIAYNIVDGKDGMHGGECENRAESSALNDKTKSLVFVNHFRSIPVKQISCLDNSADLIAMLDTCYTAAGNRWPNFVAVDFYEVINQNINASYY